MEKKQIRTTEGLGAMEGCEQLPSSCKALGSAQHHKRKTRRGRPGERDVPTLGRQGPIPAHLCPSYSSSWSPSEGDSGGGSGQAAGVTSSMRYSQRLGSVVLVTTVSLPHRRRTWKRGRRGARAGGPGLGSRSPPAPGTHGGGAAGALPAARALFVLHGAELVVVGTGPRSPGAVGERGC